MTSSRLGFTGIGRMGNPIALRVIEAGNTLAVFDTDAAATLCVDEAENLGGGMLVSSVVRQMLTVTDAKFGPTSDFTSTAKVIEEWAGVEIREKSEKSVSAA